MSFLSAFAGTLPVVGDIINAVSANRDRQNERDIAASNQRSQDLINQENLDNSKEFAQNSIQWKVEDAAKAGISPLASLGVSESQPSVSNFIPTSIDTGRSRTDYHQMGQDLSRAIASGQSAHDRLMEHAAEVKAIADADIATSNAEVARRALKGQPGTPPPNPASATMPRPANMVVNNTNGSQTLLPTNDVAFSMRSIPFASWDWYYNNRLAPDMYNIFRNVYGLTPLKDYIVRKYRERGR